MILLYFYLKTILPALSYIIQYSILKLDQNQYVTNEIFSVQEMRIFAQKIILVEKMKGTVTITMNAKMDSNVESKIAIRRLDLVLISIVVSCQ